MKKSRIYKIFLFILVNLTVFSNIKNDDKIRAENNNNIKITEEKVEIINKDEDDGYIYLDRITEEEAEEKTKKESKLVKIINKNILYILLFFKIFSFSIQIFYKLYHISHFL